MFFYSFLIYKFFKFSKISLVTRFYNLNFTLIQYFMHIITSIIFKFTFDCLSLKAYLPILKTNFEAINIDKCIDDV